MNTNKKNAAVYLLYILFTVFVAFINQKATAQLTVNLLVNANPPSSLMQWTDRKETFTYLVLFRQGAGTTPRVKIKAEFKLSDGTVIGTTDLSRARTITLADGNNIFSAADVIPLDIMQFSGKYKVALDKSGKLPANNYQLCVRLVEPVNFAPVSEERCRFFNLASLQLAIPIMPLNESVLDAKVAQTAITFRWTSVSPRPALPVTYRILVFEVLPHQQPVQAMRSNQPILNKDVVGTTQYIWQPQLGMIDCCPDMKPAADSAYAQKAGISTSRSNLRAKTFIWTIQCLDNLGLPLGDGNINKDGVSEPIIFYVGKKQPN
jgi:hypothetical protein